MFLALLALVPVLHAADSHIEVDMLVSRGNVVELFCNDWANGPEQVPVVAGERHVYQFTRVPLEITQLRLDPTELPDARIVIYSLSVKQGSRTVQQFGPAELKTWALHDLSAPREENGGIEMLDTTNDPFLVGRSLAIRLSPPEPPSLARRHWLLSLAIAALLLFGLAHIAVPPRKWVAITWVWGLTAVAILPVIFQWAAPMAYTGADLYLPIGLGYLVAGAICYFIYRQEARRLPWSQAMILVFMVLLLTCVINNLHRFNVDHGKYIFANLSNSVWQSDMHGVVMKLAPGALPHSYRFLPNSIVRWMELAHFDFESARDLYRLIAGLLVFYALYKYARLFCNYAGAMIAMLFTAAIYPISFENYAGQLTDPLSHLSFVLAFIFLETEEFALLLSTLVIGSLAKETVLAMAGYYLLFRRQERHYPLKAAVLCAVSVAAYFGVRLFVLHGSMSYAQTSGVTLEHVWENWRNISEWSIPFLLIACALLPFLAIDWKQTPLSLKRQTTFLLPVLFVSSLFFSWLREGRNFMPLEFVLAVVAGGYLSRQADPTATSR